MRLGISLGLLISALGILHNAKGNRGYTGTCKGKAPYVPFEETGVSDKYYVCFSETGDPKEFPCPDGMTFNKGTRSCTITLTDGSTGPCTSGEKFEVPDDNTCKKHYECDTTTGEPNTATPKDCDKFFNTLLRVCVSENEYYCGAAKPDCDEDDFQNRMWPDKESCELYYECVKDVRVRRTCSSGMYFDAKTQVCMRNENDICKVSGATPSLPIDLENMCKGNVGKYIPDPYYCKAYYFCVNEATPYWGHCDDKYFENGLCISNRASSCICEDADFETSTSVKVPHKDKSKFYVCKAGQLPIEKSCPSGTIFDPKTEDCF